jgi:hypothetical protein
MIESIAVLVWIASLVTAIIIGQKKGQLASAIIWSVLCSWIGLVILLFLPDKKKQAAQEAEALAWQQKLAAQAAAVRLQKENAVLYYVHLNGETRGPWPAEHIRQLYRAGTINNETPVITEGDSEWQLLSYFNDLLA